MDLNRVTLLGHISQEPKQTTTGKPMTKLHVATNFTWKDTEGVQQEKADFHSIVAWGKLGETMKTFLKKGDRIYVEGRLTNHSTKDKAGVTKYYTDVVAESMIMLTPKKAGEEEE